MTDEALRDLVGYQRRLWKMTRMQLKAECFRVVGVRPDNTLPKTIIIARILEAQHLDNEGEEYQ